MGWGIKMKAELITPKSNSLEDLQEYIASLSSVVRDKQPKSAEKLFNRLLKESVGDRASRVLEYIPCALPNSSRASKLIFNEELDTLQLFGFFAEDIYYTNARELLNWGVCLNEILTYVDFTNYKVFKCETPYFIYGQISTHNQLTTVSHSQRYAECDRGYWMPPEVHNTMKSTHPDINTQEQWNFIVRTSSPDKLREYIKSSNVVRKEVFDRGADMLQNRVFTIGGYTNNPNAWQHFFKQRLDSHTQLETREFTSMLSV